MKPAPDSGKKRKRTVPRNIGEKTGREIMEAVFGKRVMREIHSRLDNPKLQAR